MGITIKSPNYSIDLGYGGFLRLRRTVASLCPEEIRDHYNYLLDNITHLSYHKDEYDKYDARTEEIYNRYKKSYGKVMDFLYAPDICAKFTYGTAKQLLNVIGDYDDNEIYGYAGWGEHAARFKNFKEILEDSYINKKPFKWD